jgi:hypothetical protein
VDHVPASEEILANGNQTPFVKDESHMTARPLMFRRIAVRLGEHMRVQVAVNP